MTITDPTLPFESLIDSSAMFEMTDWQAKDLRYLAPMPYSANWSQMGTYKTSTGLWLLQRKQVRNALIITSKMGKGAYFSDFYKCLPESWELYNLSIHDAKLMVGTDYTKPVKLDALLDSIRTKSHKHPRVLLAHYDMFTNSANANSRNRDGKLGIVDKLKLINWDAILGDEAHRLKNRKGQWTINIKKLKALSRHLMTGTGFVNNPAEMWSLLNFLHPQEFSSYWAFRNYYCDQYLDARGYRVIKGILPHRVEEFRRLRKRLGPRHMMHTVHKDIEHPIETSRDVELNTTQRRMYNEIKATLQTLDERGETLQSPNVLSQLNRLRQVSVATPQVLSREFDPKQGRVVFSIRLTEKSSKLDAVMALLDEMDDPEQQIVIFSNFKDPLHLLEARFDKANVSYLHMEQRHSESQRYRIWHDEFPRRDAHGPRHKVFMSTLALGGESINLSCAQYLIFLDRSWSPKDMMQAIGRVYRPGQKHAVEVIYINARKTVDTYVKSKLTDKQRWFDEIFKD